MVIAHVITRLLRAGSEENTIATCLGQAREGHRVVLIHGREWNVANEAMCGSEVELIRVPELVHEVSPRQDMAAVRALRTLFKRLQPRVVHTHQSKAGIVGRIAARLAGVPTIVHGVHIVPFVGVSRVEQMVYLSAERAMASFTHAFINVSESTRQTCIDFSVGRPDQHFVTHSGMELGRFRDATPPEGWRRLVGIRAGDPKPPIVLMLAALEPRKRHLEFLDAFESVIERIPNVRLLLAGEGPMREAIEARAARGRMQRCVRVLGFNAQPERLIALADFTLLTSMREGLPRVVVQSLACGRPIVTTELPGIGELVRTGVNGIVTPADDLHRTADAVADLFSDPQRLESMQRAARTTDVSDWEVDSMCTSISGIYERLVAPEQLADPG